MRRATLLLALVFTACPAPLPAPDAGTPDSGLPDAGPVDAGSDAGVDAGCDGSSVAGLLACVDQARYRQDLVTVTGVRTPGSAHWQEVQDLCAQRLTSLGFTVERQAYATGVNVVGVLAGTGLPAERVLVSAHYDSTPNCPGADDNASGVAGALETARVLAQGQYRRSLVVACWDEEERGLLGSIAYAAAARQRAELITSAFVYEMIGYRSTDAGTQTLPAGLEVIFPGQVAAIHADQDRGDFIALIGDDLAHQALTRFGVHAQALSLDTVVMELTSAQKGSPQLSQLRRSDHAAFWQQNYASLMIGDTANFRNPNYHCSAGPDAVGDLDHAFAAQVIGATVGAAADLLELR
ncbi:MAG: M28 family peptidase [Archangium sp.]|nr:M28 family peptidase [Archangium sp.]